MDNGNRRGQISNEAIIVEASDWTNCLLLYHLGSRPFFKTFEAYTKEFGRLKKVLKG